MTEQTRTAKPLWKYWPDILVMGVLVLIAYTAFSFLFTSDPFIYDDHGFHYATLHNAITSSIPEHFSLVDWNPNWFAGIQELQFYPPGYVFIGVLFYLLTLGLVSSGAIYQAVVVLALLIPGIAVYWFYRRNQFPLAVGIISAILLMMSNNGASGVLYGVIFGLINSRLALSFGIFVLMAYINFLENEKRKSTQVLLMLLLGLVILLHPYHIFLPLLAILAQLFCWARMGLVSLRFLGKKTVWLVLGGVLLVSFWWIPLLVYSGYMSRMNVWSAHSNLKDLVDSLSGGMNERYFIVLYCLAAIALLYEDYKPRQKAILAGLVLTPVLMLVFLFFVKVLLTGLLKFYLIDPWRLQDDFYFSLMMTSGFGILFLFNQVKRLLTLPVRTLKTYLSATLIFGVLIIFLYYGLITVSNSYRYQGYRKLGSLQRNKIDLQLDELWAYLKSENQGRILFTSARLNYPGYPDHFNTHITALTPVYTERPILGAVNEPFYSTASYLYFGKKAPVVINDEADDLQNKSLFGVAWNKMDAVFFWNQCKKFNVTTLVVNSDEPRVREFLSKSTLFELSRVIGPFNVYTVKEISPAWLSTENVNAKLLQWSDYKIKLKLESSPRPGVLSVKLGYYPRWKAYLNNVPVILSADEAGLMQLDIPAFTDGNLELRYESTWAEKTGWMLTLLTVIVFIVYLLRRKPLTLFRRHRRHH